MDIKIWHFTFPWSHLGLLFRKLLEKLGPTNRQILFLVATGLLDPIYRPWWTQFSFQMGVCLSLADKPLGDFDFYFLFWFRPAFESFALISWQARRVSVHVSFASTLKLFFLVLNILVQENHFKISVVGK